MVIEVKVGLRVHLANLVPWAPLDLLGLLVHAVVEEMVAMVKKD